MSSAHPIHPPPPGPGKEKSSVGRVLDGGGGVPLMRERAKEGSSLARIVTERFWFCSEGCKTQSGVYSSTARGKFQSSPGRVFWDIKRLAGRSH